MISVKGRSGCLALSWLLRSFRNMTYLCQEQNKHHSSERPAGRGVRLVPPPGFHKNTLSWGCPYFFNLTSEMEVNLRGGSARMAVYPEIDVRQGARWGASCGRGMRLMKAAGWASH